MPEESLKAEIKEQDCPQSLYMKESDREDKRTWWQTSHNLYPGLFNDPVGPILFLQDTEIPSYVNSLKHALYMKREKWSPGELVTEQPYLCLLIASSLFSHL